MCKKEIEILKSKWNISHKHLLIRSIAGNIV
jgi:hypothetical protein